MAIAPDDIIWFSNDDWCFWADYSGDREGEDYRIIPFKSDEWAALFAFY